MIDFFFPEDGGAEVKVPEMSCAGPRGTSPHFKSKKNLIETEGGRSHEGVLEGLLQYFSMVSSGALIGRLERAIQLIKDGLLDA